MGRHSGDLAILDQKRLYGRGPLNTSTDNGRPRSLKREVPLEHAGLEVLAAVLVGNDLKYHSVHVLHIRFSRISITHLYATIRNSYLGWNFPDRLDPWARIEEHLVLTPSLLSLSVGRGNGFLSRSMEPMGYLLPSIRSKKISCFC